MLGVGGLMGIRVASSVMLGAFVNFFVLAPLMIQRGDIVARAAADGKGSNANSSTPGNGAKYRAIWPILAPESITTPPRFNQRRSQPICAGPS